MNDPYEVVEQQKFDALTFLRSIYNDPSEAKSVRMRAAIEALPFETPKLAVTASLNGGDFADKLDKAFSRSARVINLEPTRPKTMVPDRRFRRA